MSNFDRTDLLKFGEIDAEFAELLKETPFPETDYGHLEGYTSMLEKRATITEKILKSLPAGVKAQELKYSTSDGTENQAKLFQPSSYVSGGSPLLVYYHGGGWCLGAPESEEVTCRNMVQAFGAVCISIGYRLAPKHPFPAGVKDAWDGLKWAAENAKSWGADPSAGFIIGGTSAGANFAAVLTHVARDYNLSPPLTGSVLHVPPVLPKDRIPDKFKSLMLSREQNKDAYVLPPAAVDMFESNYKPDIDDGVWFAALNHPKGHTDLPPTVLFADGADPLRDEAILYERVLREDYGIKTWMEVYPGLPHSHWSFFPTLKSSTKFRRDQIKGMSWLLKKEPDWTHVWDTPSEEIKAWAKEN